MEKSKNSYEVILVSKIPFLTEFLLLLLLLGLSVVLIAYFFLAPYGDTPNEMQIVTTLLIIPDKTQFILLNLGLSTLIIYPLYKYLKKYQRVILTFNDEFLLIQGKNENLTIAYDNISKIYLKDSNYFGRLIKEKFIFYIQEKNLKPRTFKLLHYLQAEELITEFTNIDKLIPRLTESFGKEFEIDSED